MKRSIGLWSVGILVLLAAVLLAAPAAEGIAAGGRAGQEDAAAAFAQLGELVGDWRATTPEGSTIRVNYRFSAAGSVLVETWAMPSGRESLTLYHLDGDRLMATHYCPQGNQPRLQLDRIRASGRMEFAFRDGGNLAVAGAAHQHAMWLHLKTPDRLLRSETYVDNHAAAAELAAAVAGAPQLFERIAAKADVR